MRVIATWLGSPANRPSGLLRLALFHATDSTSCSVLGRVPLLTFPICLPGRAGPYERSGITKRRPGLLDSTILTFRLSTWGLSVSVGSIRRALRGDMYRAKLQPCSRHHPGHSAGLFLSGWK
jgi:hypothetical protein